jgi:hypothetical protein
MWTASGGPANLAASTPVSMLTSSFRAPPPSTKHIIKRPDLDSLLPNARVSAASSFYPKLSGKATTPILSPSSRLRPLLPTSSEAQTSQPEALQLAPSPETNIQSAIPPNPSNLNVATLSISTDLDDHTADIGAVVQPSRFFGWTGVHVQCLHPQSDQFTVFPISFHELASDTALKRQVSCCTYSHPRALVVPCDRIKLADASSRERITPAPSPSKPYFVRSSGTWSPNCVPLLYEALSCSFRAQIPAPPQQIGSVEAAQSDSVSLSWTVEQVSAHVAPALFRTYTGPKAGMWRPAYSVSDSMNSFLLVSIMFYSNN